MDSIVEFIICFENNTWTISVGFIVPEEIVNLGDEAIIEYAEEEGFLKYDLEYPVAFTGVYSCVDREEE